MRCQFCGKLTVVRIAGKGDEFTHRCSHCRGRHRFTKAGVHGSGAINYRVTKIEAGAGKSGVQDVRTSTGADNDHRNSEVV